MARNLIEAMLDFDSAVKKANQIIAGWQGEWPEDEWFAVSEDWDLNLYSFDGDGEKGATLYPVLNGRTVTDKYFTFQKE